MKKKKLIGLVVGISSIIVAATITATTSILCINNKENTLDLSTITNDSEYIKDNTLFLPKKCDTLIGFLNPNLSINKIYFNESISKIVGNPFIDCDKILDVFIPKSNTNFKFENGLLIDESNSSIISCFEAVAQTSIVIPNKIKKIGEKSFCFNKKIKEINVSTSVNKIGIDAFRACASLKNIKLPIIFSNEQYKLSGSSHIGLSNNQWNSIFWVNNKNQELTLDLSKITRYSSLINNGVLTISQDYYNLVGNLNSAIEINEIIFEKNSNIDTIPNKTFFGCKFIKKVTLPQTLLNIGDFAFYGCKMLSSINILKTTSNSLKNIGQNAFYDCPNLVEICLDQKFKSNGNIFGLWAVMHLLAQEDTVFLGCNFSQLAVGQKNDWMSRICITEFLRQPKRNGSGELS